MNLPAFFRLKTQKVWWMDVIFYFTISLLMAIIASYFIFWIKNISLREDIKKQELALETVATAEQREEEEIVIKYQKKIKDFTDLLQNYEFASNVFAFLQSQTFSDIWFKKFILDKKNNQVQLLGECDNISLLSRQIDIFENESNKEYIQNIGNINFLLGAGGKIDFNLNLMLTQNIFSYISNKVLTLQELEIERQEPLFEEEMIGTESKELSSEKSIISFQFLSPEVRGVIDEENHIISCSVPHGTSVKNLTPLIIVSSNATVSPSSNTAQDFTNPVIYSVTAEDGSIQTYEVRVNVAEESKKTSSFTFIVLLIVIISIIISIVILFFRKKAKTKLNF